jgi:HKD family nuclease
MVFTCTTCTALSFDVSVHFIARSEKSLYEKTLFDSKRTKIKAPQRGCNQTNSPTHSIFGIVHQIN